MYREGAIMMEGVVKRGGNDGKLRLDARLLVLDLAAQSGCNLHSATRHDSLGAGASLEVRCKAGAQKPVGVAAKGGINRGNLAS